MSTLREELREQLTDFSPWVTFIAEDGYSATRQLDGEELADALLLAVEQIAKKYAAEELRAMLRSGESMQTVTPFDEFDPPQRSVIAVPVVKIRDRAAALDAEEQS